MSGTSNITGLESITFTDNMSFDGTNRGGAMTTDGQLWIGSTSGRHVRLGSITAGAGITISNGPGSISVALTGGGSAIDSFTTDVSGPVSPNGSGNVAFTGATNIFSDGSVANTMRLNLQGTDHTLFVGRGTNTASASLPTGSTGQVLQSSGAGSDPAFSTATYPSTTTISQILYSSSANVVAGLTTANSATLVTTSTGVPVMSSTMTNGQMIIGSTGATPTTGTITSTGGTITVTTGAGTLNLEVATGGFTWTDATSATQAMAVENGYVTDRGAGVVYTLPASAVFGSEIKVVGKLGLATITPNANQQILIGSASGTVGVTGTIVSNNVGDCIDLIAITAGASTVWRAANLVGTWTVN